MVDSREKFSGLPKDQRMRIEHETSVLALATMARAQLDYATTMILQNCAAAPFGLDRLRAVERNFTMDLEASRTSLGRSRDGDRRLCGRDPGGTREKTAPLVEASVDLLDALLASLSEDTESKLALSLAQNGSLELAMPAEAIALPQRTDDELEVEDDDT
jgi:hypothetical protein